MKPTLITLTVLIIGILTGFYFWHVIVEAAEDRWHMNARETAEWNRDHNRYLIEAVRDLLKQPASKRKTYLNSTSIFARVSMRSDSSEEDYQYFQFDPSTAGSVLLPMRTVRNFDPTSFDGFYVALDDDGRLIDFGFHKY